LEEIPEGFSPKADPRKTVTLLELALSINLLLGLFNMVPAFPLDGGRVFRSILWGATRRLDRATHIAALVGQGFGFLMIGLGLVRLVLGDPAGGVWTIFIGWFLSQAAGAARRDRQLGGVDADLQQHGQGSATPRPAPVA